MSCCLVIGIENLVFEMDWCVIPDVLFDGINRYMLQWRFVWRDFAANTMILSIV